MGNKTSAINEGPLECSAPNQTAYLADFASCFFFQMPLKLDMIGFGYISFSLLFIVFLISLFGQIKPHCQWFIFNMVVIDILVATEFLMNKNIDFFATPNCQFALNRFITHTTAVVNKFPPIGLFVFAGYCFMDLYFPKAYHKWIVKWRNVLCYYQVFKPSMFTKNFYSIISKRNILAIIFLDAIYMTFISIANFGTFANCNLLQREAPCVDILNGTYKFTKYDKSCFNETFDPLYCPLLQREMRKDCLELSLTVTHILTIWTRIERGIWFFTLLGSVVFVLLIFIRLGKSQSSSLTSDTDPNSTFKIAVFLSIQTVTLISLFVMDFFKEPDISFSDSIRPLLPYWLNWLAVKGGAMRSFQEIRVFVTYFTTLSILPGYKEDFKDGILWICKTVYKLFKLIKDAICRKTNSIVSFTHQIDN